MNMMYRLPVLYTRSNINIIADHLDFRLTGPTVASQDALEHDNGHGSELNTRQSGRSGVYLGRDLTPVCLGSINRMGANCQEALRIKSEKTRQLKVRSHKCW